MFGFRNNAVNKNTSNKSIYLNFLLHKSTNGVDPHIIIKTIKIKRTQIFRKIGGEMICVQVDETAICQGRIIENSSSMYDDMEGIQWLIGGVEVTENKFCFLEIAINREAPTILDILNRNVLPNSIIISDGFPSYPLAVRQFGSEHIIVPHNQGFTNADGYHTNLIENLWSHLKVEYKIRRGVKKENMEDFIYEFYFKKYYIQKRTPKSISNGFFEILKILFE
ncbi:hypothetical protein EQH57_0429 [Dictyocoela roeselum]|nr:hypothetical protein EQH57_0429 [Dictyocoela roeselum]